MTESRRQQRLDIGADFALPADLVTQTLAIVGVRGSGKTVTAAVIVEELLRLGQQAVIIDPTDVWWGLKSAAGGKVAGFPVVVLGGAHGDLPLTDTAGAAVADFVVEHPASVVLSLRHLRKGRQRQFVTDFAEQLYHRKGEPEHRTPLFIAIDEASQFVPQRMQGEQARMVGAIQDLVRLGRAAGLGVALIDQRPASVNKDVLTQLEVLVAHRITSPQDRKALDEWIQQHDSEGRRKEFLEQLAPLPTGTAWFWAPALDVFRRVAVRMRHTFDSSRTPKPGERPAAPEKVAAVDLDALRSQLEETIAEAEANDPRVLKGRIAELERELRTAERGSTPAQEVVDAAIAAATSKLQAELSAARAYADTLASRIHRGRDVATELVEVLRNGDAPPTPAPTAPVVKESRAGIKTAAEFRPPRRERRAATSAPKPTGGNLPKGEATILTAVCQYPGGVDRTQLSILTGYKRSSRDTYVQRLRERGLVEVQGAMVVAAEGAEDHLGEFEPLPTGSALQDYWLDRLPTGEATILAVLLENAHGLTRDQISNLTEYKRSSRDTYIQRLRARKIVDADGAVICASEMLFD